MKSIGQRVIAILIVVLILAQMLLVGVSRYQSTENQGDISA